MEEKHTWIKPIAKSSLSKMVMDNIKEGIIQGDIKPGEYLPSENELAARFGVGKSSVREAVKMLEALGYVEIEKGTGCRVRTSVDPKIINPLVFQLVLQSTESREHLLEFRLTIETAASLLAIDKADSQDIEKLQGNFEQMQEHLAHGASTLEDDHQFHLLIYASTHNPYLMIIGKTVMELFHHSLAISNRDYPELVVQDHEQILNALKQKDRSRMIKVIEETLNRWYALSLGASQHS